jgi:predicted RNase H-like HicB family nuclease
MTELVFEVTQEEDGGFCAECLSENIFTQGDSWQALRQNVQEAVRAYYFDRTESPKRIRLHLRVQVMIEVCRQISRQIVRRAHEVLEPVGK